MKYTTKTTIEYPVADFNKLVLEKLYPGKNARIEYVVREFGGHDDRYRVTTVTSIQIVYDHDETH